MIRPPPSSDDPTLGFLWPAADQQLLLDAALLEGEGARTAFRAWRASINLEEEFSWTVLRLLPLVHDTLARAGENSPMMGRLKGVTRRAWYETQQLFHRTRPAVAGLRERGIPVILLKGVPLVIEYYRHHALRPMSDIDMGIPVGELPGAIAYLQESGWRPSADPTPDYLRFRHALQFRHPEGGELDLHWHILYEAKEQSGNSWGWAHAEPLDFLGVEVQQQSPTCLLLLIVVHGVRWNEETPVRWIPDAMMVLRRRGQDIDWPRLIADARALKVTQRLALGLEWLVTRYAAPIPPEVTAALQATWPTLTERVEERVYLSDFRRYTTSALGNSSTILADLCRIVDPARPFAFAAALPSYLRFRWKLRGRREIVPVVWRALRRRLRREPPALQRPR